MVTSDNPQTAKAIALECGILSSDEDAVEPNIIKRRVFCNYSDAEREEIAGKISVIERSSTNDQLFLVQGLKKRGHVVAATGDGTNDAPVYTRSRYDDDDYINLCHKISWLPQVLLSFTVPSRLYILLVQGFLLADFALENINIYKAAKFLERQARKTWLELIFAVNIFILSHKGCKILLPGITGLLVGFIAYASEFSQPYDALYKDF